MQLRALAAAVLLAACARNQSEVGPTPSTCVLGLEYVNPTRESLDIFWALQLAFQRNSYEVKIGTAAPGTSIIRLPESVAARANHPLGRFFSRTTIDGKLPPQMKGYSHRTVCMETSPNAVSLTAR